ncbi:hypothetical protein [Kineococcus sp. SYSU DK004]|uniref:hypothetical protein n=1 Tax=Kineococcus sp. SYSU DK004 TaxID=3383125 RepID=UPI003D7CD36F
MSGFPWTGEVVVRALRERLLGEGAVTAGFAGLDVRAALPGEPPPRAPGPDGADAVDHVVVLLRWRQDPCLYGVAFALEPGGASGDEGSPPGVSTGLPVDSPQEWAQEVAWWLAEELGTGLVRRAGRARVGDVTFLER